MKDLQPDTAWWADSTAYQIYPRSFQDSDGDGIGDIAGIIDRLDHLADLGIEVLWLSPIYASPMADNGYDIADYRAIAPEFGTLEDFDRLLTEARARGIGVVMDLVVNHTSDRHAWFQAACASRDVPEHDFYIWREPHPGGGPPDDRQSYFGGPAWTYVPGLGRYYLHLYTDRQPDLNWQNPALRAKIYEMMNWWLDRGIAGFRMDVIDLIGKDVDAGLIEEGPYLHEFLQEMHRETLTGRDVLTVGESWRVSPQTAMLYSGRDRNELSMVFQFNHIVEHWDPAWGKWKPKEFDLRRLKRIFNDWQAALADDGWNALFLNNHDLPRMVSTYGCDDQWRERSAKMLATVLHLMKGTPFVYQGEEIGMTNVAFDRIEQFRDVETLNLHRELSAAGVSDAEFIAGANANSRDNARTPMQWSGAPGAGFTSGTPWIETNPNHAEINVAAQRDDPTSVLSYYKRLIALRKSHSLIVEGSYAPFLEDHPAVFAYTRERNAERLSVLANFTDAPVDVDLPAEMAVAGCCLVANVAPRSRLSGRIHLAPYEALGVLGSR